MRQEMGKVSDKGPRKLDQDAQRSYKEVQASQAMAAKDKANYQQQVKQAVAASSNTTKPQQQQNTPIGV